MGLMVADGVAISEANKRSRWPCGDMKGGKALLNKES